MRRAICVVVAMGLAMTFDVFTPKQNANEAGGLALGTSAAGFKHETVIERDRHACDTIRENNRLGIIDWPLFQGDVRQFDFRPYEGIDLLAGGPRAHAANDFRAVPFGPSGPCFPYASAMSSNSACTN